mgnify:CR=1 FL=1
MEKIGDFFTDLFFDSNSEDDQEKMDEVEVASLLFKIRMIMDLTKSKAFTHPIFSSPPNRNRQTFRL